MRFEAALINRDAERIPVSVADRNHRDKIYDYYGASGVIDAIDDYLFDKPLLLIGEDGANLLNRSTPIAFMARGKYWVNNHAHVLDGISEQYLEYIALFINSISLAPYVTGTAQPKMNQQRMGTILLAIPPEREQERILARIAELDPLVSKYGVLEESRTCLDAELPDRLRKSILQMAVEGKLVEQDPADEPASALLERIRAKRAKLVKEKKIKAPKGGESVIYRASDGGYYEKRGKGEPVCIDDEIPFEIPDGWEWVRLGTLLSLVSDGTHKTPEYKDSGIRFLSVQNISKGYFDLSKIKYISQETHDELCKRVKPQNGDILLCRIGTLGKPIVVDVDYEFSIFVSLGLLRLIDRRMNDWVVTCIDSPIGFSWIQRVKVGGGTHTFKINLGDIPSFLIPVPPINEQLRIEERIDQLLAAIG